MPVQTFNENFDADLEQKVIHKSIYTTGDVANKFYEKRMRKMVRNQGTQSETLEELFRDTKTTARILKQKLDASQKSQNNLTKELQRISLKLSQAQASEGKMRSALQDQVRANETLSKTYKNADQVISEVKQKLAEEEARCQTMVKRNRQLEQTMTKKAQAEREMKARIANQEDKLATLTLELD